GPTAAALPSFLRQELVYPYFDGSLFVNTLRGSGGWRRVDAAYRTLPTTTAQILFPSRYLRGQGAVAPAAPRRLPRPWRRARAHRGGASHPRAGRAPGPAWVAPERGGEVRRGAGAARRRTGTRAGTAPHRRRMRRRPSTCAPARLYVRGATTPSAGVSIVGIGVPTEQGVVTQPRHDH